MKWASLPAICGAIVGAVGLFLAISADSLATRWQRIGDNAWGGTTDVGLRAIYHEMGLIVVCFGAVLLAMAAWNWLAADRGPGQWRTSLTNGSTAGRLDP